MRRISVLLASAAALIVVAVSATYAVRLHDERARHQRPAPQIKTSLEAVANSGWRYEKDDPQTNKPVVVVTAKSFEGSHDPAFITLHDLTLRIYDKNGGKYTFVRSNSAEFSESSGVMNSSGPVQIVMNVPADKDAANPADVARLVQVDTSGVHYDTQSGKANTDEASKFHFPDGDGSGTGVSYDPNTGELVLKKDVALDWVGRGPAENRMHIEAGNLVYREKEHKINLTPWSKMTRQGTSIQAQASVVQLDADGYLQQIDATEPNGQDVREDKTTRYAAHHMIGLFNEDGILTSIEADGDAKVTAAAPASITTLSGDHAHLEFVVSEKQQGAETVSESDLKSAVADGHAVAENDPVPQAGVKPSDTRILRSQHIEMAMAPDGKTVQEIRTNSESDLEFKPNTPDGAHRLVHASRLDVLYGSGNYIQSFTAQNASTRTDKKGTKGDAAPALTWSDVLAAKFAPQSNNVSGIDQTGHFRYEQGTRKAKADQAHLDQKKNAMTLSGHATVSDDTGSALADTIIMDQTSGDMDASGHVYSTHAPDPKQKPGTSMLDATKTTQAKADRMTTRNDNTLIVYDGHASVWQGANRISADRIRIDRDEQTVDANGDVVSELVDNNASQSGGPVVVTVVHAPELHYADATRTAKYTGGVELTHGGMVVDAKQITAFLTPSNGSGDSSLDHAFADGAVKITDLSRTGVKRVGTSEHAEYFTADSKVILNGGNPQLADSRKGITRGKQLTYFSDDDRMIVQGETGKLAYTQMKK